MSEPWGQDVHSALVWSFNALARSALPQTNWEFFDNQPSPGSLTPLDFRAQAGMIRHVALNGLARQEQGYLIGNYLPAAALERLGGGRRDDVDRWLALRTKAIDDVAAWLVDRNAVPNAKAGAEIVRQYVMQSKPRGAWRRLAKLLRMNNDNVNLTRSAAYNHLHELRKSALAAAEFRLQRAGLIP